MPHLEGKVTDYGDLLHVEQWLVKGRRLNLVWRLGVPRDTKPEDRRRGPGTRTTEPGRTDVQMDLQADKQVPLSVSFADELGHAVGAPDGAQVTYTVDDDSVIALTDNGDGTATAAATGELASAIVHVEVTAPGMPGMTGDLLINVIEGDAERVEITAGEPEEVTADNV